MQHHQMLVAVGGCVTEGHLVAAAEAVVFIVAQKAHGGRRVAGHPILHGGLGAIGGAVVDDDALPHPGQNVRVQQLRQHARDLFFTVVSGDENK